MIIIVDIAHPAHVNFFKGALKRLKQEGHEVIITALRRGKLPRIVENELSEYPIHYVGRHRGSTFSIIVEANLLKFFRLFWLVIRKKADFGLSVGSFNLGAALTLMGKPNLQFDDDPERKMNVMLEKLTSTRLYFPPIVEPHDNVENMRALKEWAYLSPTYFQPQSEVLNGYGVLPRKYIFVREVSSGSLNYQSQDAHTVASFAEQFPTGYPVILSLEDKEHRHLYPQDWLLLQEPVADIHSVLYYSSLVVSSGDSMAREGALLGVPSIYVGVREMKANLLMIERKMLFKLSAKETASRIPHLIGNGQQQKKQAIFRENLRREWDDITDFVMQSVYQNA